MPAVALRELRIAPSRVQHSRHELPGQSTEGAHGFRNGQGSTGVRRAGSGFLWKPAGANRRKRFSTKTHRKPVLSLQESPKISGNLRELAGEYAIYRIRYSSSLLQSSVTYLCLLSSFISLFVLLCISSSLSSCLS